MAFLSTFQKTQSLRMAAILPKLIKPSCVTQDNSSYYQKYVMSPEEASLTAKFNDLHLKNSVSKFQSFPAPSSINFPTLDRNKSITYHIPVNKPSIEDPNLNFFERFDPLSSIVIEEPESPVGRMEAARLVVIRRRKMKKHQLRKLRKRMKYVHQKRSQKREYKKEKIFQKYQMDLIREAHAFDPVAYVRDIIAKAYEKPPPRQPLPKSITHMINENKKTLKAYYESKKNKNDKEK